MSSRHSRHASRSVWAGLARYAVLGLAWTIALALTIWALAAISFDWPFQRFGPVVAASYLAVLVIVIYFMRAHWMRLGACLFGFALVLIWWLSLSPSNDRPWQGDVMQTAWAEVAGDRVTIHNVRNFTYHTETDYTPRWETRSYDLTQIRGADLFITFWGSPWIAHPIVSFDFADGGHVAFSVETRKVVGQEYSAILGFFRQYELIYIVADERDVIRLRTNYRKDEEVYLYRTTVPPEAAREIFLDYLRSVNALHEQPAFYNAITSNCTTNIRIHTKAIAGARSAPWDWRLLLNGKGDEYAYQYGRLESEGLPFEELKRRAHINDVAREADVERFSQAIREGRPGFAPE